MKFSLPAGQVLRQGWEATFTVDGQDVTARSLPYNSEVAAQRSVTVGFYASGSAYAPGPAQFRVNDNLCSV